MWGNGLEGLARGTFDDHYLHLVRELVCWSQVCQQHAGLVPTIYYTIGRMSKEDRPRVLVASNSGAGGGIVSPKWIDDGSIYIHVL